MSQRPRHPMSFFDDHDEQDRQDLAYGGQRETCERLIKAAARVYKDPSITRSWRPEED